jgi:hypothetical protein
MDAKARNSRRLFRLKSSQIHNAGINLSLLVDHAYNPIHWRYLYAPAGELTRELDKLRGDQVRI